MRIIKIFLITVVTLFILIIGLILGYQIRTDIREKKEGKEILTEIIERAKTKYNFTMNKDDFEIKVIGYRGGYVFKDPPPIYGLKKKGIVYKSKYFKELEDMYYEKRANNIMGDNNSFFGDNGGTTILKIVVDFGLQPYILHSLIYDKTKGNDFEKIEQIFSKYGENITYKIKDNIWDCGGIDRQFEQFYNLNYVKNINCSKKDKGYEYYNAYNSEVLENYGKKYEEYFSKPRSFENINWEEYMKIHEIHPIIQFYLDGTKEEKKKLQKEIEPYYNKEILDIIIE